MSTFYGGPQLSSITSFQATTSAGVSYNVPAGFFAIIKWHFTYTLSIRDQVFITINGVKVQQLLADNTDPNSRGNDDLLTGEVTLASGINFSVTSLGRSVIISGFASVELYKNP